MVIKLLCLIILLLIPFASITKAQPRFIPAEKAREHLGETKEVQGYIYYSKILEHTAGQDSVLVVLYLSGTAHTRADFAILIKCKKTDFSRWRISDTDHKRNLAAIRPNDYFDYAAEGSIFLFEGLPAVNIKLEKLGILEPVS